MGLAAELAHRICGLQYSDLPDEAVHGAKIAMLDTVGVTLAGANEDAVAALERVLGGGEGPCLVVGRHRRTDCLDAALINGTAAHALDFDDCSNTLGGHPSAPIVPAVLALAEVLNASGRDVLLAYVVGFETETRLARGVNFYHYEKGWHPTATLGIFGAAAGCARLLGLSEPQTETALALSVSLASGVKANFGTMTKPLHVGHCARNGLFAALLAREGYTASPLAFEHEQGFLNVFNGPGKFNPDEILRHWADPLDIVDPGVAIKQYPCCGSTHPAIDAMLTLIRTHGWKPDAISRIDSSTHSRRLAHTNRPDPQTALEAKFSVQYCLARALLHGRVVIEHFEGEAFRDPAARRIMQLIHAAPYSDKQFDPLNHFGAEVAVTTVDGRRHTAKVASALGRTSKNPLPPELLKSKFETCAARALPAANVSRLYALTQTFENLRHIRDYTSMMLVDTSVSPAVVRATHSPYNYG